MGNNLILLFGKCSKKSQVSDQSEKNKEKEDAQNNSYYTGEKRLSLQIDKCLDECACRHGKNSYRFCLMDHVVETADLDKFNTQKELDQAIKQQVRDKSNLIDQIRKDIIGNNATFKSPFSVNYHTSNEEILITYCDYIASGKPVKFIEDFLRDQVLPTYANSHTTSSYTGFQTTHFREEARKSIGKYVNANDSDVILFEGSGSTSAIQTLVLCLGIEHIISRNKIDEIPVVFVSPYEHHSNLLPWRESGAIVVQLSEDRYGNIDLDHFKSTINKYNNKKRLLIGSFSAGSNVTGVLTDCDSLCEICHENGALCFFDYAATAPYVPIDMNSKKSAFAYKDAVFISPHKFVGGPGSPGLLIAKRHVFRNKVPHRPGGGTVNFVDKGAHCYTNVIEEKEEGGTPDIIGSIRCALAFKLKDQVGCDLILKIEEYFRDKAFNHWIKNPNIVILGPDFNSIREKKVNKLAFFSFLVKHDNYFLHQSYVSALLNDLFGIQTRGGCSCAGPYGQELLGMDFDMVRKFEDALLETYNNQKANVSLIHLKPGWSRLNLNYFFDEKTVDFVLKAVDFIGYHAWEFLPLYKFDPKTNEWKYRNLLTNEALNKCIKSLDDVKFLTHHKKIHRFSGMKKENKVTFDYDNWFEQVQVIHKDAIEFMRIEIDLSYQDEIEELFGKNEYGFYGKFGKLRWYLLPSEALKEIKGEQIKPSALTKPVFVPKSYPTSIEYVSNITHNRSATYCSSLKCN
jgi:selenocysteine lyase/cysteine desulfurase